MLGSRRNLNIQIERVLGRKTPMEEQSEIPFQGRLRAIAGCAILFSSLIYNTSKAILVAFIAKLTLLRTPPIHARAQPRVRCLLGVRTDSTRLDTLRVGIVVYYGVSSTTALMHSLHSSSQVCHDKSRSQEISEL